MKIIEVTNPTHVVNKEFELVTTNGKVPFYEDDYLDIKSSGKGYIINDTHSVDKLPIEFLTEVVELVEGERLKESSLKESSLSKANIVLK